jgi:mono/diheme cytochrome c family protein
MNRKMRVSLGILLVLVCAGCVRVATPATASILATATSRPPTVAAASASATALSPAATAAPATFTPAGTAATSAPATFTPPARATTSAPATFTPPSATAKPLGPTATPPPTPTPVPPTPQVAVSTRLDPAVGQQIWQTKPCRGCHGDDAQGVVGPKLAGTGLSVDQVLGRVRTGKGIMPAFTPAQVSDLEVQQIYAWLRSMAAPAPTPISRPPFPTQALVAMWSAVNEMKVRADIARDLSQQSGPDDAARLRVIKQYASDGIGQARNAVSNGNQALSDVPREDVRQIIRAVIDSANTVSDLFNQASAQGSYPQAYALIVQAVGVCRLDALPWACQAVRDAGLTGTVRVHVSDQSGAPVSAALVTVLSAHPPLAGRTDGSGFATFANVAALPVLEVKAYLAGMIYHEVNVNLSPGAAADVSIVLPGTVAPGTAPVISNPAIVPDAGSGSATITLQMTVVDPQGADDLAVEQVWALNADLHTGYVLRRVSGNQYAVQVPLPNLSPGLYTWFFLGVDRECNTSDIIAVRYTVQ